jgi:Protein of unknown function (DUF3987)
MNLWPPPNMGVLNTRAPAVPCPVEKVFSKSWATYFRNLAELKNAPVDYGIGWILPALATTVGATRVISPWRGWTEFMVIWSLIVGDSGEGKSPPADPVRNAIYRLQSNLNKAAVAKYRADLESWKSQPEDERSAEPTKPDAIQIETGDASGEALLRALLANPRGVERFADEIKGLIKSFGRYYSKAEGGEKQAMLTAYRAQPYAINRVGFKDDPNGDGTSARIIPFFFVCMAGGIQPDAADFLLEDDDDGFLSRFWVFFPDGVERERPHVDEDNEFLFKLMKWIRDNTEFANGPDGLLAPHAVMLEPDAAAHFEKWWKAQKLVMTPYTGLYRSWLAKAPGFVLRMAGLLTIMEWAEERKTAHPPETITLDVIRRSILFVDCYLTPMAERFLGDAYKLSEGELAAALIAKYIKSGKLKSPFNAREEIQRARLSKHLSEAEIIKDGLRLLIHAHWIRPIPERAGGTGGKPKGNYEVNPMVYTASPTGMALPIERKKPVRSTFGKFRSRRCSILKESIMNPRDSVDQMADLGVAGRWPEGRCQLSVKVGNKRPRWDLLSQCR